MGVHFTLAEDDIIKRMWEAGEKINVIGATLGRSYDSIHHRIDHLGLQRRYYRMKPIFSQSDVARIIEMREQGCKASQIAAALGFSRVQITRKLYSLREVA